MMALDMQTNVRHVATLLRGRTFILLTVQIVTAGSAFMINLLAANALDPSARGVLALWLQIGYLLTTVALLGVERPYVAARAVGFRESLQDLARLTRFHWVVVVGLGALALVMAKSSLPLSLLLGATAIFVFGNVRVRWVRSAFIGSHDSRQFVVISVLQQAVLLLGGILLYALSEGQAIWWLAAYIGANLVVVPWCWAAVIRDPKPRRVEPWELSLRRQGVKLFPASLGNTAMLRSDRLLLPFLASTAELGIYVVVATVMEMAHWPVQQWVDSSLKKWAEEYNQGHANSLRPLFVRVIVGVGALAVVLGITAYIAISLFMPEAYQASKGLIFPLGVATVVYSVSRLQQGVLIARGLPGRVSWAEMAGMASAMVGYVILIPMFGSLGAAVGSILGYSVTTLLGHLLVRVRRVHQESEGRGIGHTG